MRAELHPEDLTAIVDTREQTPLDLGPLKVVRGTLPTGDYSIAGLENVIAVERKSLDDFLQCVGRERERFDREMQRILAYPHRLLVVEATWREIEAGNFRSRVAPAAAVGSAISWMTAGIPMFFAGNHLQAGMLVSRFLFIAARRRWRELIALQDHLRIATKESEHARPTAVAVDAPALPARPDEGREQADGGARVAAGSEPV